MKKLKTIRFGNAPKFLSYDEMKLIIGGYGNGYGGDYGGSIIVVSFECCIDDGTGDNPECFRDMGLCAGPDCKTCMTYKPAQSGYECWNIACSS